MLICEYSNIQTNKQKIVLENFIHSVRGKSTKSVENLCEKTAQKKNRNLQKAEQCKKKGEVHFVDKKKSHTCIQQFP